MRISDSMLVNSYLHNLNTTKAKVEKLRTQIASQSKINKPSDAPGSAARILRLNKQNESINIYLKNIREAAAYVNETSTALDNTQEELTKILTAFADLNNTANTNLDSFADQIDLSLKTLLDVSNTQFDGKYIFGGTDHAEKPFGFSSDGSFVEVKSSDISGEQKIRVSANTFQRINLPGGDVFGTTITQNGNLNSTDPVGTAFSTQTFVYDSSGAEYTLDMTYTKTAANTYSLSYDIVDGGGVSVYSASPAAKTVTFNPASGEMETIDGIPSSQFRINVPDAKIDFALDISSLKENSSASSSSFSANQKVDIFNVLLTVRDNLRAGIKPTEEQEQIVKDFNTRVSNLSVNTGNLTNQLTDSEELLKNQQLSIQELISNEQEVDIAAAVLELQNYDYVLQLTYEMSATTLQKSLLDYI